MATNEMGRASFEVATRNDLLAGGINSETISSSVRSIQAARIQRRFFLSLPVAMLVAELAYQGGRS